MNLTPSLLEVNFSRGIYSYYFDRAWCEAGAHFQRAIAINPRSSLAQVYYAVFLTTAGRREDAVQHVSLALQLDPLSPFVRCLASATHLILGRFDEAERAAQHALELQPDYLLALWPRGLALSALERHDEAIAMLERTVTLSRAPIFVGLLGLGYARAGQLDDPKRLLAELEDRASRGEYVPAFAPLSIYVGQGDVPAIRRSLAKAIEEFVPPLTLQVTCGQYLQAFRSDPEIHRMLFELYGW